MDRLEKAECELEWKTHGLNKYLRSSKGQEARELLGEGVCERDVAEYIFHSTEEDE